MPLPPYAVYSQQLALCHGYALWEPDPSQLYDHVSIGDVGYVRDGLGVLYPHVQVPSRALTCLIELFPLAGWFPGRSQASGYIIPP